MQVWDLNNAMWIGGGTVSASLPAGDSVAAPR